MTAWESYGAWHADEPAAPPALCWQRPGWSGAQLRPRWLLLSVALHVTLIAGAVGAGLWPRPSTETPQLALHRVLGGMPQRSPEPPPPRTEVEVAIEEQMTVELAPEFPAPEPSPIESPKPLPPQVIDPVERPRRRPDLTVIRRITPPPQPTAQPELPPPSPPAVAAVSVAPVPLDDVNEPPGYPPRAVQLQQEGTVWLRVRVGEGGDVIGCRVASSSGYALLDRAALAAVQAWRFRGGAGEVDLPIEFVLRLAGIR